MSDPAVECGWKMIRPSGKSRRQATTPSPGAMSAAKKCDNYYAQQGQIKNYGKRTDEVARIIDAEMGMGELVEIAELVIKYGRTCKCRSNSGCTEANMHAKAKSALARVKGSAGEKP